MIDNNRLHHSVFRHRNIISAGSYRKVVPMFHSVVDFGRGVEVMLWAIPSELKRVVTKKH
jgi:hypothetical protein